MPEAKTLHIFHVIAAHSPPMLFLCAYLSWSPNGYCQELPRQTKPKKDQFMNFSQGHSGRKVRYVNRACFPKEKHQNSQKWVKFMNFSFWPPFLDVPEQDAAHLSCHCRPLAPNALLVRLSGLEPKRCAKPLPEDLGDENLHFCPTPQREKLGGFLVSNFLAYFPPKLPKISPRFPRRGKKFITWNLLWALGGDFT